MSKPNKARIETTGNASLTHNPFASLEVGPAASPGQPDPGSYTGLPPGEEHPRKLGRVVLRRETAHRGGKSVIVVDGFPAQISDASLEELSKKLRKSCGCGGALKERRIELQGDQAAKIRALLQAEGFQVAGV